MCPLCCVGFRMSLEGIIIRPLAESDSLVELTNLLHRAYAKLAAMGLNYTAVDQPVEVTARRISRGQSFVALCDGRIIGTLTVARPYPNSHSTWHRAPEVVHLNQFAVEPTFQGRGIGSALLARAEAWSQAEGFDELAMDTAEPASHLLAFYGKRGYRFVGHIQWEGKRYRSVIFSKRLTSEGSSGEPRNK